MERNKEEEINNKNNNSVGANKIKSGNLFLFCSSGILDGSSNTIKVKIIPSLLVNAGFDTKFLIQY